MKQVSINPRTVGKYSRYLTLVVLACIAHTLGAEQPALAIPTDLNYDVWMDNRPLGTHSYRFSRDPAGGLLQVDSQADFEVKVVFVTVFSYDHKATELWNERCLTRLSSTTTTNGKQEAIELRFDGENCAGTYAYWDSSRLQREMLTNAQTGKQEEANWQALAPAELPRPNKKASFSNPPRNIAHFQLEMPSASFLLWYDDRGRNLAMQTTNDGRTITYLNRELLQ